MDKPPFEKSLIAQRLSVTADAFDKYRQTRISAKSPNVAAKDNEILIYGPIVEEDARTFYEDWWEDESFVSDVSFKEQLNGINGDVVIRFNSPGGSVFVASSIMQAITEHEGQVNGVIDGICASAATAIMATCNNVTMAELAQVMIHRASTICWGNQDDIRSILRALENTDNALTALYKKRMKDKSEKDIHAMMASETWLSADDSLSVGLVNEVSSGGQDDQDSTATTASAHDMAVARMQGNFGLMNAVNLALIAQQTR